MPAIFSMILVNLKRFALFFIFSVRVISGLSQDSRLYDFSAVIFNNDSLPLANVAVLNPGTGKLGRTSVDGFFRTQMAEGDSLVVSHIAYTRLFLHLSDNCTRIYLQPESYELKSVTVYEDSASLAKKMNGLTMEIKAKALLKKLEGYEKTSRQEYFYLNNSVRAKASSPYFGPTANISFGQIAGLFKKLKRNKGVKDKAVEDSPRTP